MASTSKRRKLDVKLSEIATGSIVNFPKCFPLEFGEKEVYARSCYSDLFTIFKCVREQLSRNTALRFTGTPGIGKTYFLFYFVYQLLLEKEPAIFVETQSNKYYFYRDQEELHWETDKSTTELPTTDFIHIVDPQKGIHFGKACKCTILFSSPSRKRLGSYSKSEISDHFVPPWTETELRDCCSKLYGGFDEKKFEKWGGIIRAVVANPIFEKCYDKLLDDFVKSSNVVSAIRQLESSMPVDDLYEANQWILHRWPVVKDDGEIDYTEHTIDFPSDYVKSKVATAVKEHQPHFLETHSATLRGNLYEHEVRKHLLCPGRTIMICDSMYTISGHKAYTSKQIINAHEPGVLYVPFEENRKAIDYVMPPFIFQVTINQKHDSVDITQTADTNFPRVQKWTVCFIVPPERIEGGRYNARKHPKLESCITIPYSWTATITSSK